MTFAELLAKLKLKKSQEPTVSLDDKIELKVIRKNEKKEEGKDENK
jgi:uncharacterized protein YigA (DUF484 family)